MAALPLGRSAEESAFIEVDDGDLGKGERSRACLVKDRQGLLYVKKTFKIDDVASERFMQEAQITVT
jgi:hypothetical protein